MNTFWLKVTGGAVVIVVIIIAASVFLPKSKPKEEPPQKTVYDVWEKDDKKFGMQPKFGEQQTGPNQPVGQQQTPQQPTAVEPPKPQFRELTEEEKIEADRVYQMALAERKMGRLPVMTYKRMVDYCREIIRRWPGSEYAYNAKRMLADLPDKYRQMYNITSEEINLGNPK